MRNWMWRRLLRSVGVSSAAPRPKPARLAVESLERRDVPAAFHPSYVLQPIAGSASPHATSGPTGLTPTQVLAAYGFNKINFNGVAGDGTGTTIAIVDAYDDPTIANDLHQFDLQFGLPDPSFKKVNQSGGTSLPAPDAGWSSEIALDVEWAHAIAPKANILLVEAFDNSDGNLFAAARYAAGAPGVVAVSMSFGGGEYSGQTAYDSSFTTPAGHGGVVFVASAGDAGSTVSYPATSPNVLSVGGTTLNVTSAGSVISETVWSGSGGGISTVEAKPAYQQGVVTQSSTFRTNPDVSYDANPNTGFPVYDSYNNGTSRPWAQFGGTSAGSPQWAALVAIADQGRALAGLGSLDGAAQLLPKLYSLPAADFRDIVSGSTGIYSAGTGYDLATGRGSPIANLLVPALVGSSTVTPPAPTLSSFQVSAASTSVTAGTSLAVTVTAIGSNGSALTNYLGAIQFASSDLQAGLPANYTFVSGDNGTHTFYVTLKTAGSQTVSVADVSAPSAQGSASAAVSAAAPSQLAFGQQPASAAVGAVLAPVAVRILDAYGNLVANDSTDSVTLTLASNPGNATLGGTTTVVASGGVATFSTLTLNHAGSGYAFAASSGALAGAKSSTFNIAAPSAANVAVDFETSSNWYVVGGSQIYGYRSAVAAHDGALGFVQRNSSEWIYRTDSAVQNNPGDSVSVWLQFASSANGRAYFGFGSSSQGTLSLVAAPNTNQLILQANVGFGFVNLAAVSQSFSANHWYKLQVNWGASGRITGVLLDSDGATPINSVAATVTGWSGGGIALRATGSNKYWDTIAIATGGAAAANVHPHASNGGAGAYASLSGYFGSDWASHRNDFQGWISWFYASYGAFNPSNGGR